MSIPRALLLALALLQAVGITDYVRRATCEEECKRDGCKDDCLPGDCSDCACHCPSSTSITPPVISVVDTVPPLLASVLVFEHREQLRATPDPREILHVPRNLAV